MKKYQEKHGQSPHNNDKIGRFNLKFLKPQVFLPFLVSGIFFQETGILEGKFENLLSLTKNRWSSKIYLITSNPSNLVMAMKQGFNGIPIVPFTKFDEHDFELNILENYLLKLRLFKDYTKKNIEDFGYLLDIIMDDENRVARRTQNQSKSDRAIQDFLSPFLRPESHSSGLNMLMLENISFSKDYSRRHNSISIKNDAQSL